MAARGVCASVPDASVFVRLCICVYVWLVGCMSVSLGLCAVYVLSPCVGWMWMRQCVRSGVPLARLILSFSFCLSVCLSVCLSPLPLFNLSVRLCLSLTVCDSVSSLCFMHNTYARA